MKRRPDGLKEFLRWVALPLFCGLLLGTAWDATFEAIPDGATALASDIDTFIKDTKREIRQRVEVEHKFGPGSTDDNGLHELGSARCFQQNAAPTDIARAQYNATAGADAGTTLTTEEAGPSTDDIGKGRCWIDLDGPDNVSGTPDDFSLAIWNETLGGPGGWAYVDAVDKTTGAANQRFLFDPGKYNLLYNNQFQALDGLGGTVGASTAVPAGWTLVATNPTISYTSPPTGTTEGSGIQVNLARGAGDGGIEQTVILDSDSTYYVAARTQANGGATCELSTANAGGSNLAAQTTTSVTYTTLSGTFTTTAGAVDTLTVRLRVLTAGTCRFSQVQLYKVSQDRRGLGQPGPVAIYRSDTSTGDVPVVKAAVTAILPNLTITFVPPTPGWIVEVHSDMSFSDTAGSPQDNAQCNLDNGSDMAGTPHGVAITSGGGGGTVRVASMHLSAVQINPTPGTAITYTVECESTSTNIKYNGTPDVVTLASNLWIVAIPPR